MGAQPSLDELRGGLLVVADELHDQPQLGLLDRIRDRCARLPGAAEHRPLLYRPEPGGQLVAESAPAHDGALVAGRQEPTRLVDRVAAVGGRVAEALLPQLTLGRVAGSISLVGKETRAAPGEATLDQEDLGLLAGL